jgi:hypothetical protein
LPVQPILNRYDSEDFRTIESNFQLMSDTFSSNDRKFSFKISSFESKIDVCGMSHICSVWLTRPDKEYWSSPEKLNDTSLEVVTNDILIAVEINGVVCYEWSLNEIYFKDNTLFKNSFITGHSVIELVGQETD